MQKQTTPLSITTTTAAATTALVIDGHRFDVSFDDIGKLRALLNAHEASRSILEGARGSGAERDAAALLDVFAEVSDTLRTGIDRLLGDGSFDDLFGGDDAVFRAMSLVRQLAEHIGPIYDKLLADYTPKQ